MQPSWHLATRIRFLLAAALLGIAAGIFVLFPLNEFVYFYEYAPAGATSGTGYAVAQLRDALRGVNPPKTAFYAVAGLVLSLSAAGVYSVMAARGDRIEQLRQALNSDLRLLIATGESATLEFKSSFRWDLKENRTNRALETVIMKTIAGYMNSNGGTLLIGVGDEGEIVGLDHDYQALKKRDRDGFEQALMTGIASKLGADACRSVQVVFSSIEGKDVCRVIVSPGHRPVYLRDGDNPKLYVRTGVSTRELNVQEAIDYTGSRWKK